MEVSAMAKLNVSIDDQLREELFRLVPPRRRSQVVNEALRHELLRRKRQHATEVVHRLRKRSATFSGKDIVDAVRRGRERTDR
jgi:metal-responsive CopG/Arc/MetJ family transcriptional regulator